MIILGLDPGSVRVGYGIIREENHKFTHLASGLLRAEADRDGKRLVSLENHLCRLIKKFRPETAVVEKLFFAKNQKTALGVAEARGVLLNALYKAGLPVWELAPSEVKSAVAGHGRADKKAVAKMVFLLLGLPPGRMIDDAADALAIAIAGSNRRPQTSR